jgi:outer membrane protein OmpA-like peptidoglycan-associated protein
MRNGTLRTFAAVAIAAPIMAGCASKGFVRQSIADERAQTDSSIAAERTARMAADSTLSGDIQTQIASLRQDLDSLRTEFGAKITALESGIQFDMPVHFAFDDATIRDQDRPALDRFAKIAQKYYPGSVITVEGFADPAGSRSYNVKLSARRADAVKSYLQSQGLTDDVRTVGYGKSRLVVPGAQKDMPGAEENRRVVFVIETPGQTTSQTASTSE